MYAKRRRDPIQLDQSKPRLLDRRIPISTRLGAQQQHRFLQNKQISKK